MTDAWRVPFQTLTPGEDAEAVRNAIARVLERGWFVLGPEVDAFEREFAAACGVARAVGVGTGTDAIALALTGLGIGRGDEVITTSVSAAYTGLAVLMAGARPVFADVDPERLTLAPAAVSAAITPRTAAILPVHLYGQAADMPALSAIAERHDLAIIEDCCQAHLATCAGRPVGTFGAAAAFSFYPTKNLGAVGDGGAVVTGDVALADRLARLRNGGQADRYHHVEPGVNSRLDELQAAVLRERLPYLARWTEARRRLAGRYDDALDDSPVRMLRRFDDGHVYHLLVVRSPHRDALQGHLKGRGIQTLIHYPIPLPRQPAFESVAPGICPAADDACSNILSLPLHPALGDDEIAAVADAVRSFSPVGRPR